MSAKTQLEWRLIAKDSASDAVHKASKAYQDLEKELDRTKKRLGGTTAALEKSRLAAKRSKKDVDDSAKAWSGLSKFLKEVKDDLGPLTKIGLGGAAAGVGIAYWLKKTAEEIDSISKTSDRLGITTEALSSMGAAAKLAGVDSGTLELAIQRMARRIGDASRGFGEATKAFSELGIEIQEIKDLRAEDQFIRIKRALEGVENTNRRLSLGAQIFDSEGIRVLQMSADSMEEIVGLTREFGYSFSRIDGAKVEAANDSLAKLQIALNGLARVAVVEFAPAFQGAFDDVLETLRELGGGQLKKGVSRFFLEVGETVQIAAVRAKGELVELKDTIQDIAELLLKVPNYAETGFNETVGRLYDFGKSIATFTPVDEFSDRWGEAAQKAAGSYAAAIESEITAIRAATAERLRLLDIEKDLTAETEKRYGIVRSTIIGPGSERADWPTGQSYEEAYRNAFGSSGGQSPMITRLIGAQNFLVGAGTARALYSQWLELGRQAAEAYTKGLAEKEAAQESARETAELWGKHFVSTFSAVREAGESLWDKLKDAGVSAMERIREEQQKQHDESIRKLTEQRLFYQSIGDTIGYGIVDSIEAAIDGTGNWRDVLRETLLDVRRLFLDQAMRAIIGDAVKGTGLFGLFLNPVQNAKGNVFSRGDIVPFARGGIVTGPTFFPMVGGKTGLMGEAGEEAIVPLRRGPSGRLGIDAYGAGSGGATNINLSLSAVDAPSFVRLLNSPEGQRWFQATFGRMQQRRIA